VSVLLELRTLCIALSLLLHRIPTLTGLTSIKSPVVYLYQIHGQQLKHSDCAKYQGVRISNDMRWSKHIDMVSGKANSKLGFVKRNVNISSRAIKEQAYKTLRGCQMNDKKCVMQKSLDFVSQHRACSIFDDCCRPTFCISDNKFC